MTHGRMDVLKPEMYLPSGNFWSFGVKQMFLPQYVELAALATN
jgi:hypothetical protein